MRGLQVPTPDSIVDKFGEVRLEINRAAIHASDQVKAAVKNGIPQVLILRNATPPKAPRYTG